MRKIDIYIIGMLLLLVGCDTEESDGGDLDGFWKVTSIAYGHTGWQENNMAQKGVTWAFQGNILELRDLKGSAPNIVCSFEREGNRLTMHDYYFVDREKGDRPVESGEWQDALNPYGLSSPVRQSFDIVVLTSKRLRLEDDTVWLELQRY